MNGKAYYNDVDEKVCAWVKELISAGEIMDGDVDCRSITEIQPNEIEHYSRIHLFCGIAGWDKALQLAGWNTERPVLTASCPCPPFSCAGKKKACPQCASTHPICCPRRTGFFICCDCGHAWLADARHLWPEVWRIVSGFREPRPLMGEQVASEDGRVWLAGVRASLEILGYAVRACDLPAAGVAAPHKRQRLWWLADSRRLSDERRGGAGDMGRAHEGAQGEAWERQRCGDAAGDCGADGGLVLPDGTGREPGGQAAAPARHGDSAESAGGAGIPLGDATGGGRGTSGNAPLAGRGGHPERADGAGFGGLDNAASARCERTVGNAEGEARDETRVRLPYAGRERRDPWGDYAIVPCRDGKGRRIESGVAPLVAGLPRGVVPSGDPSIAEAQATGEARVMRLRGYGNAVNVYVAKSFIEAYLDCNEIPICH